MAAAKTAEDTGAGAVGVVNTAEGPTKAQRTVTRAIPCAKPQGLAFDGSNLWCVDLNGTPTARRFGLQSSAQTATMAIPEVPVHDIGRDIAANQLLIAGADGWLWRARLGAPAAQLVQLGFTTGVSFGGDSEVLTVEGGLVVRRNSSTFGVQTTANLSGSSCTRLAFAYNDYYRICGVTGSGNSQAHRVQIFNADSAPTAIFKREITAPLFASAEAGFEVRTTTLWIIGGGSGTDLNKLVEYTLK